MNDTLKIALTAFTTAIVIKLMLRSKNVFIYNPKDLKGDVIFSINPILDQINEVRKSHGLDSITI